jgi:hypothetical protein
MQINSLNQRRTAHGERPGTEDPASERAAVAQGNHDPFG